jgi:hypothetical protein
VNLLRVRLDAAFGRFGGLRSARATRVKSASSQTAHATE